MNTKYKKGIVIGKFYPFHNGHKYLIETGLEHSESLTVILCQTRRYKIPAKIRAGWIRKTFPGLDVRILNHSPSLDSGTTALSQVWADLTVKFLGFAPDVVFSSENYGDRYSSFMGSKHFLVDLDRKNIPISATKVRSDIGKYWDYLPQVTKDYFIQKVVVLGAESTGTTTLARDLAIHFHTAWAPEYGRLYYEGRMFAEGAETWTTAEFIHIAVAQNNLEDALLRRSNRLLICDTDAFATTLWHERYLGYESDALSQLVKKRRPLLYILTDIDIPFVQDGTRDGEHIRTRMHQRFVEKLTAENLNFIVVSGGREKRLMDSIRKINDVLTSSLPGWS